MKLSVSLPDEDVVFLDAYAAEQGFTSRSAVLHKAVRVLRGNQADSNVVTARSVAPETRLGVEPGVTLLDSPPPAPSAPVDDVVAAARPQPAVDDPPPPPASSTTVAAPPGPAAHRHEAAALFARLRAERLQPAAPPVASPPPAPERDEARLQARDMAVEPVEHLLAKKVKRLLADHQNAVLDRLRARRPPGALELLGEIEDLLGPLAAAAEPLLRDAASAGAAAAGAPEASVPSADLARDVAANVVKDLRPRLEVAFSVVHPERRVDRVNVAFREWRGERVGRLVGDAAYAAYARGHFVATRSRKPLRWVADDGERPCPDCEDNSLAGPVAKGSPFPTGHRHPPAHSGCRCLLVASPDEA